MPAWSHLHPAIVHFPIALLMVAPLLVALGLLWPAQRAGIHGSALILLILGTAMAVVAVATGMAVTGPTARSPELLAALDAHERLGKWTAFVYAGLTLGMILIQFLPLVLRQRLSRNWMLALHLSWLAASLGASLLLIQTGHLGGRMVHELGAHATTEEPRSGQSH